MARRAAARSQRPRKSVSASLAKRNLLHQTLERREMLAGDGPELLSVAANSGENFRLTQANVLMESPTQLTFRFDGSQQLNEATLAAISIQRSGGDASFTEGNEIRITPGFLGFGDSPRIVIARFAESLPDDQYRISIAGFDDTNAGIVGLRNTGGELFQPLNPAIASRPAQTINFQVEIGPQVVAVVPQPVTGFGSSRVQQRSQIQVYFNNDPLSNPALGVITTAGSTASVVNPQFYRLFFTANTVENTDDTAILPNSVSYDPALNVATLEFSVDLALLPPAVAAGSSGTYRLRVGSSQALPAAPTNVAEIGDTGNTFTLARNLATTFNATPQSLVIAGQIEATTNYPVQWPGFNSPGVRENRIDSQITGQPDTIEGINRYFYNFASVYGVNPQGQVLDSAITPAQRQRAREILSLYADHLGVEFIETADRGLQIVTGSLSALVVTAITGEGAPFREYRVSDSDPTRGVLVLDSGETWYDGYGLSPDARPSWFVEALGGIGTLLGLGSTFDQVPGVASGSNPALYNAGLFPATNPATFSIEPDFLSSSDIIPGQALHRPETRDADLYRFNVAATGTISIETFAQRLDNTSALNTDLKLWKRNSVTGQFELVARNDDFYSLDSFIGVEVTPNANGSTAEYVIGITATGNDDYNPDIVGSGSGGRSQGQYQMRITFQNRTVTTIRDTDGSALDGDGDGVQGGDFNFWFRTAKTKATAVGTESRTLFVDKAGLDLPANGDLATPYKTIAYAFTQARSGDVVRLLASAGGDNQLGTTANNLAYEIGRGGATNAPLADGTTFNVPRGVTVMVDAGAIIKLGGTKISVGSERSDEDRSLAALQILGVPTIVDSNGTRISGEVIITSYNEERRNGVLLGVDTNTLTTTPSPGNWAGIEFRNDFDYSEGRPVWETEGIFLDYVSHADIRYGGGSISSTEPAVNPLQMLESRPALINNSVQFSLGAALSADPNSFLETNFHAPLFQRAASFTSDYDRVGPDIRANRLTNNLNNSLVVRVRTPALDQREPQTVSGRLDDRDVVHSLSDVLVLRGQAGGSLLLESRPDVLSVTVNGTAAPATATTSVPVGTTDYRITFINSDGSESLASLPTRSVTVTANQHVNLTNLPATPPSFVGRRLYRLNSSGNYVFVTQLDRVSQTYTDTGRTRGGLLPAAAIAATTGERLLPRYDARLSIDPGLVLKLDQARIEASFGSDFYAEGTDGNPIVFTHRLDDTYGAGGTFDTNNDSAASQPLPGSWGGLVFRQGSTASLDNVIVQYAGGTSGISGGSASFNPVEILQADVRIANSLFANNADGNASGASIRDGIGFNGAATIFVRGAQPIIVDNIIRDNLGAAISANPDSLNYFEVNDAGRSTGVIDRFAGDNDNQGPLIAGNRLDDNAVNGLLIRNESLTTESVWDDTDIVHVLEGQVYAYNYHHRSGLRLKSDPNQSLVVKSQAGGSITADRYRNDIEDSIGGTLQVIGAPGFPVVLTSINDCEVGAGFTPDGLPQNDTIESGACTAVDVGNISQFVDVIVVIDESGSLGAIQAFTAQFITDLEAGLVAAGVGVSGGNRYGAVGFGNGINAADNLGRSILVGGNLYGTALDYVAATSSFVTSGVSEDGYAAINFALDNYTFRPDAAKFIILATDEPRSALNTNVTLASTISRLQGSDVSVVGILRADIIDGSGQPALAIDNTSVYVETATGFTTSPGGTITGGFSAADHVPLVTATNGITGDLTAIGVSPMSASNFSAALTQSLVRGVGLANPASSGDWQGIRIVSGANDRNVAFINEAEQAIGTASGVNAIPSTAQVLGSLAQSEVAADENRRLGFNVRGTLSQNNDLDVYTFFANGGTEAHIDIDDTSFGLDTVVELIDSNGNILAQSNNSLRESSTPGLLVNNIGPGAVLPLYKSGAKSVENPNELDAGLRVVLAGSTSLQNQYYIRVRSNNSATGAPTAPTSSAPGLSSGQYQLSLRLRETDEVAGSTIRLADIRYATVAIDVPSAPSNSPLAGEHAEELNAGGFDINDTDTAFNGTEATATFTNASADPLGSLNSSNRGVLRVTGSLGNQQSGFVPAFNAVDPILAEADLDVYRVDILDERQNPSIIPENRFVSTTFDIDYADGVRANTSIAVYNAAGRLILHSRDSFVADDQGRPLAGIDQTNLSAGSFGQLDAYIGPVELQVGTYYVVVSSAQMIPATLGQLFDPTPVDTNVRVLPVDSVRNLAEFGFDENAVIVNGLPVVSNEFAVLNSNAELSLSQPFFDNTSIVPYALEDVRLFVTVDRGITGNNRTALLSIDPFTGQLERLIGEFDQPVGDLAIRPDGRLFGFSLGPSTGVQDNGNSGNFLNISPADGTAVSDGDDGLTFRQSNAAGNGTESANPDSAQFLVNAIAFTPVGANDGGSATTNLPVINANQRFFAVGNRDNSGRVGEVPFALRSNVIYSYVNTTGEATNQGSTNGNLDRNFGANTPYVENSGPASNKVEFGVIDVGQFPDSFPSYTTNPSLNGPSITGLAQDPNLGTQLFWAVTDRGALYSFDLQNQRTVDVRLDQFDPLTLGSYDSVINTRFRGEVVRDAAHPGVGAPAFSSLTFGPRTTSGRRYENVLFATTTDGWLYTFEINAQGNLQPAPVLSGGRSAVQILTSLGAAATASRVVTGVAFSIREENPFHTTADRNTPFAGGNPNSTDNLHGVFAPHDQTRIRTSGGNSLYFGFEPTGTAAENTINDTARGNLAPGGVHGSSVSRPFSLESYASGDKPTLYFNYFIDVEADDDYTLAPRAQVDSFRVFATGDDGQWRLLATNDAFRSFVNIDEYDYFGVNGGIPVQELFDDGNVWRQARIDLSPLAGQQNVQLRFDFSTAGGMQSQRVTGGYLTEIQAVAGSEIVNGSTFSFFDPNTFTFDTFEFVRGAAINIPAGANLFNGQQIQFARPIGGNVTITLTTGVPVGLNQIAFARGDDSATIAAAIALRLQTLAPEINATSVGGQLLAPDANSAALGPPRFGHAAVTVPVPDATLENQTLTFTNAAGVATTLTLETSQQLTFGTGPESITVTSTVNGAADNVNIQFVDQTGILFAPDVPATATFNAALRVITVTFNSNPANTLTNNDYAAIVAAIDGLAAFDAVLATGNGATAFASPAATPVFSSTEVYFNPLTATAATLATAIATELNVQDSTLSAFAVADQLIVIGATTAAFGPGFTLTSANQGSTNSQLLPSGNIPVFYNRTQTSTQVRDAIRLALVNGLGTISPVSGVTQATIANYPGYATNRIRVFERTATSNTSAVGFSTFLPGDEFGAFGSTSLATNQINPRPGENNNVEGLYIDDVVVGFAERGEVVLNAPVNRDFVVDPTYRTTTFADSQQPEFANETLVGAYTLEIRKGAEYGVPQDYDPIRLGLNEQLSQGRSFDTNDRLASGSVTLIVPSTVTIQDGDTFTLSNGSQTMTFEFDRNDLAPSVVQGNVRVPFTPVLPGLTFDRAADDRDILATSIRDAINSDQAFGVLGIRAAGRDGNDFSPLTGNRVDLFGNDVRVNASSGRFLKVDLVAAETPYGKETGRTIPVPNQAAHTVGSELTLFSFPRATPTRYVNGATDTLVAVGKIGDAVGTFTGNELFGTAPGTDVDILKIFLVAGNRIDIDLDTTGFALGNPLAIPRVRVFNEAGTQTGVALSDSGFVATTGAGEFAPGAQVVNFTATATGYYYLEISSANGFGFGDYQLTVRPNGAVARDVLMVDYHFDNGDKNVFRDQGQLIIESNFISDFATAGVRATFNGNGVADEDQFFTSTPLDRRPGSAATLRNANLDRLLPGTVISNNVIFAGAGTGIIFSGEAAVAGNSPAPVPFGRIVNNTVVGTGAGTGIAVSAAASPTVLNNVISSFGTGLNVSANSSTTVVSTNTFQGNGIASNITVPPQIDPAIALFQDPARNIYIPAVGSPIIDSSTATVGDRDTFRDTVKIPVGISPSPIFAPIFDAYGIPRFDGASGSTSGVGQQQSIDRGGIDRADFARPSAILVNPIDFIAGQGVQVALGDIDPDSSFVRLPLGAPSVAFFEIQLLDPAGSGPDADTITSDSVILTEDGVRLTPGIDYTFGYSDNSRVIRLTPTAGLWRPDSVYEITLNNQNRVSLELPAGDMLRDGDQYIVTDSAGTTGNQSVFEFDSGYALQVPQTLGLTVLGPNTFFNDGDTFTITAPSGVARTFEINLAGAFTTGNIAINLATAGTIEEIRNAILAAISTPAVVAALDLAPRALGQDSLQIGSLVGHTITGSPAGLSQIGVASGVTSGDQLRYVAGPDNVLFEFTFGAAAPTNTAAVAVPIARSSTIDEIAVALSDVIVAQPLGLAGARSLGNGRVLLGGNTADVLTLVSTQLQLIGQPGVAGALRLTVPATATAASLEGRTFTIRNGSITTNFVFTTNPALPTTARRVVLAIGATPTQIATAMAAEINAGFVGALSPTANANVVTIGEQSSIIPAGTAQVLASANVGTTSLVLSGVSGGAIAVPFLPTGLFSPAAAAGTLAAAIATSPLTSTTFSPGGGTLLFSNTRTVQTRSGSGPLSDAGVNLPAIADLATNAVAPNRDDGETRFTIIMPEVRFDFGDAPASYGTLFAGNGARHSVGNSATPRLGTIIDTEADGQPFPLSDDTVVAITANSPGASPLFAFAAPFSGAVDITINAIAPTSGSRVRITIAGVSTTFELVTTGIAPVIGNIPVALIAGDTPETIASRLSEAIALELGSSGSSLTVTVDALTPNVVRLQTLDDEEGVAIGTFSSGATNFTVFLTPGAPTTTTDPADVLGFLNPQDPLGSNISVTVTGAGLIDAWIDFDGNGVFTDANEQVLTNAPVVDGVNTLRVFAPAGATDKLTWARFRLSTSGNLRPTGVAVGGEVEDYQVQIINVALPTPADDTFAVDEDTVLNTITNTALPSVITNDTIPPATFLPVRFFVGQQPSFGSLQILDATSGRFIYTPAPDYSGVDTFTYRLSTQANAGAAAPAGVTFATVTINVRPINDAPSAVAKTFTTIEDTSITITAAALLAGSIADGNPQFPPTGATLPWNEANQNLRILSLQSGTSVLNAANFAAGPLATPRGSITANFDVATGDLINFVYTPAADLNRDNVTPVGSGPVLDQFTFTVQDDGILIDQMTGLPPVTRLTATATATIDVAPQNDTPTLVADSVSVGIVGSTTTVTPWRTYFTNLGQTVPVPTEDADLSIPLAFLLLNDVSGRSTTVDENNFVSLNDGSLSITGVTALTPGLQVSLDGAGNVLFVPPADIFGDVVFTYDAVDQGINEDVNGVRTANPLTSIGTVTVTLQPINDLPVAFDRNLAFTEAASAGSGPAFTFNATRLITGIAGETPAVAGQFDPALPAPFNEIEQMLRVVGFRTAAGTVDVNDLPVGGNGTLTLASDAGGTFAFDFVNGIFTVGRFTSSSDFTSLTPFAPTELLEFLIADDGRTTRPQGGGVVDLADERAVDFATATITVSATNDAPTFAAGNLVNVLELDDSTSRVVAGFATGILPGPAEALDEIARQTVSFVFLPALSTVPAGLMLQLPQIAPDGTLTVFPAPDAVGNATYVFEAVDAQIDPATGQNAVGFVERRTRATVTIAVRPVNDAPRLDPTIVGTSQTQNADEAWSVATDGTITYTLKEDNTGPLGVTSPYIIEVRRDPTAIGYSRIGLIDIFNAGPANEEDGTQGGSQTLRLFTFQTTTTLGGTIRALAFDANGDVSRLEYIPPTDFNNVIGGVDTFTFEVQDNNPGDGETFNLATNSLVENRMTSRGTVQFQLNPVNDPPRFVIGGPEVSVSEDNGLSRFEDFVTDIFAGPPNTAFDEVDANTGQTVTFSVTAVSGVAGLFATAPAINPAGELSFVPALNAYGTAVFEVRATDSGADNATRGDIVSSSVRLITINVRPINDAPVLSSTNPLVVTLNEDSLIDNGDGTSSNLGTLIPLRGTGGARGLLDLFNVGPANEAANITPGGNQSITLSTPIPAGTLNGGTLTQELDLLGNLIGLRYTPRANFNGLDSFVYGVIDNGVSVDLDGTVFDDFREGFTTVQLQVVARNDAPVFGGAPSVTVLEDATTTTIVGQTIIPNWATNIQAGPAGAADELDPVTGQTITFTVIPMTGNPAGLFNAAPTVSAGGTLTFTTSPNANGVAVFTVVASDSGPAAAPLEFNTSSPPRTFTISVSSVNDAPTFIAGANVVVDEDSGPYVSPSPYATSISPGPTDEVAAGQTVRFSVITPASGQSLFLNGGVTDANGMQVTPNGLPTIGDDGILRFTPADNVSGSVVVTVEAVDSEGARSAIVPLTITIGEVNDVPFANNDTFAGDEDTAFTITPADILGNDIDPDINSNPLENLTIVGLPSTSANGAAITVGTNGQILYDPRGAVALQALAPGQTRSDTFTYRVRDAVGRTSNLATVTVNVAGINDAPQLLPDTPTLVPDGVTIIRPLDNDTDIDGQPDPSSVQITLQPAFGSVVVQPDGTIVYTPFAGFRGQDQLRYTVADNLGLRSEEASITIDINQAPIAVNDVGGTFRDEAVDINVAMNDSDPDGMIDRNSIVITRAPLRGTAVVVGGGIVRFLPEPGFVGVDSFQYTISDTIGRSSNVGTVSLQTVGSRLQNPRLITDVNASGQTSPVDALLIINLLARSARAGTGINLPVGLVDRTRDPHFYDVDGSQVITTSDALRVINQIGRDNRRRLSGGGNPEGESAAVATLGAPIPQVSTIPVAKLAVSDQAVTQLAEKDFRPQFAVTTDEVVAQLAGPAEEKKMKSESERQSAVDAVWADAVTLD